MKIGIVSDAYYPYPSGVTEHTHHLAVNLRRLGHRVVVLTTHYPGEQPAPDVVRVGHVWLIPMNQSYATAPVGLRLPAQVCSFLRRERFDLLHLQGPFFPDLSFWALHYSQTVNVGEFLVAGFGRSNFGASLFRNLFAAQNRKLHGHIALSTEAHRAVAPYFPGEFEVIPSGVDTERFNPDVPPLARYRAPAPRIVFVGRLDRRKGLLVLLDALHQLRSRRPEVRLVVAGDGPQASTARARVRALGLETAVDFLGAPGPDELPACYTSGTVYCSPALGGESFGIVLLEAMAAGRAVVASAIPGYRTLVRDGVNGLLAPAGDAAGLARQLECALTRPELRHRLGVRARRFAEDFSWPRIARRTLDYYQRVRARQATAR